MAFLFQLFSLPLLLWFSPNASEAELIKKDFSAALMPKTELLGFIGEDKQRIYIQFNTIYKDSTNALLYHIIGNTTVKGNRCDFKGSLRVRDLELISGTKDSLVGRISGKYYFTENPNQQHVGIFEGQFWALWLSPDGEVIEYHNAKVSSDEYRNNQYEGIWTEYGAKDVKMCNWGEHRIPQSGDLDIGAAEFSANPKYKDQGWWWLLPLTDNLFD